MTTTRPDPAFWNRFAETIWEQAPLHQPGLSIAGEQEVFAAVIDAAELEGTGSRRPIRMFTGMRASRSLPPACRPRRDDGDPHGYARRLREEQGIERFCLVVDDPQGHHTGLFSALRGFLGGLMATGLVPPAPVKSAVFLGNYDRTAFGVHRDTYTTFSSCVIGRKRMRLWPDAVWTARPRDRDDHRDALAEATTLELAAGDLGYWPSWMWHVGESDELSMSLNLGVGMRAHDGLFEPLGDGLRRFAGDAPVPVAAAGEVPAALHEALAAFRTFARAPAAQREVARFWLKRRTACGLDTCPPAQVGVELADGDRIRLADETWLDSERTAPGKRTVAANGLCTAEVDHPGVFAMIDRLRGGGDAAVAELIDGAGSPMHRELLRAVLERLYRTRALVVTAG